MGFYQNCRGLRTKLQNFNCNTAHFNYSFIVLTETWLNNNFFSNELGLTNYNVFRCDRSIITSNCKRGGGVLIGIRSNISSVLLPIPDSPVEHLFVKFTLNSLTFILCAVYFPPSSSSDLYLSHLSILDFLIQKYPSALFIFCGDYNLPYISWTNNVHGLCYSSSSISLPTDVPERFCFHGFFQHNNITNPHGSLLDLVLSNSNLLSVCPALESVVPPDSYHPPFLISFQYSPETPSPHSTSVFDFSKSNYPEISSFINSFNWEKTFLSLDANDAMSAFVDALHSSILLFVPKITIRQSSFPNWFSHELKSLVSIKNRAHASYKASGSLSHYRTFSLLRARYKFLSKKCYRDFISRTESSLLHNPRYFWSFIRKTRSTPPIPSKVTYVDSTSEGLSEAANLFSNFFSSVYSTHTSDSITNFSLPLPSYFLPNNVDFSSTDVSTALKSLRNQRSSGPDGIQGHFLFMLSDSLAYPLSILFKKSINSGIFPSILKLGSVTPIHKSGCRSNVTNYRPITILPHLSKIFESLVHNSIRPSLNHIISDDQHGFRPGRSTTTCNLVLTSFIFNSFAARSQVDVIYTDFSKAFDRVDHSLLVKTLDLLGIGEPLLSWIRSYLTNRRLYVKIQNSSSKAFYPSSGVPQGAVLSPLLFALFINSASSVLKHSKLLIFADDMKLYSRISSLSDCQLLQSDLNRLVSWGESLNLYLNISKCSVMSFSRIHTPIQFTYHINNLPIASSGASVCDLGFTLTPTLCPLKHIEVACCKALKLLGFINRTSQQFHLLSPLKTLYCSLVRPILEYGSVLWDPSTSCGKSAIERVQRKFLHLIAFRFNIPHPPHDYSSILHDLQLTSLVDRRHLANILFLSNLISGKIDSPSLLSQLTFKIPRRLTRSSLPFIIPLSSSNYALNSPISRLMRAANSDPSFNF